MSFRAGNIVDKSNNYQNNQLEEITNQPPEVLKHNYTKPSKDNLSKQEIALILGIVKNTTFKGDNIEILYNIVSKLQNQYTNLDKNV